MLDPEMCVYVKRTDLCQLSDCGNQASASDDEENAAEDVELEKYYECLINFEHFILLTISAYDQSYISFNNKGSVHKSKCLSAIH